LKLLTKNDKTNITHKSFKNIGIQW